jgi:tRNA threonylcarbamoyladenosine biosynthesis protein TsaB
MRVLALDTTTRAGSAAIVVDERVLFEEHGDPSRTHAERLPTDLIRGLAAAGLAWADIDLFAVAAGPGSFTGLRVGIATVQGLAFVQRKRVVPVSALLALSCGAAAGLSAGAIVGSWMDAHRGEVFTALYRVKQASAFAVERLAELEAPAVGDPASTWARWARRAPPEAVVGDGAVRYADAIAGAGRVVEPPLLASIIARMAIERARHGETVDPAGIQALYVRRPDAEIARGALHHGRPD